MGTGSTVLHVTNGDSAVAGIRAAGIAGEVLAWQDVLHEGPVPAGLSPARLAAVRALFLADCGWVPFGRVLEDFQARDARLEAFGEYDELVLWFEHDLYDQLQLLQVLDRIRTLPPGATRLTAAVEDAYIGELAGNAIRDRHARRCPPAAGWLETSATAWQAFTSPDPSGLPGIARAPAAGLPFLPAAIARLLEEYPAPGSGLARTERQILEVVGGGATTPATAFRASQDLEPAKFMGDDPLWLHIARLLRAPRPLLRWTDGPRPFPPEIADDRSFFDRELEVTADGEKSLAGRLDHVAINGNTRWIGGVRIGPANDWRYDPDGRELIAPA